MRFRDIPKFIQDGGYCVDIPFDQLEHHMDRYINDYGLQMQPDFQRAHVWTDDQSSRFVEFLLRGGQASRIIYFNHPGWMDSFTGEFVLVDGLQRVTACLKFLKNELAVCGHYLEEFTDKLPTMITLRFNVNRLQTKAEVLQWYLDLNSGGVVHTNEELNHVRDMLKAIKGT